MLALTSILWGCHTVQAEQGFQPVFTQLSFEQPVLVTHAPGYPDLLFVVEQGGQVRYFDRTEPGEQSTLFFDIRDVTDNRLLTGGEQGLLGLAFHPQFQDNGWFYVNYTAAAPRRTVVSRYRLEGDGQWQVNASSETQLLTVPQDFANHNGGMIAFGPDDKLYIGMGDGGSGGDPNHRAQDGRALLGKLLRLNPDGSVPQDNPFVSDPAKADEIWALGLRNPWRFSFDRETGDLWLGDVGQNAIEEINRIERGGNYGWRWYEGSESYKPDERTGSVEVIDPVYEYPHSEGQSVTGGVVFRGPGVDALQGWYLFGDFVSGRMWALNTETTEVISLPEVANPSSFGEDADGNLYVTSYRGTLHQLVDR
ncbi:hypothetical protein MED297_20877 [Reinekea sp. MED297]|uniref:Glucose/Sorbosone dehydrogenase domain-containing protein n=2 Tax=Reinekea TaxID=230494 RepID=A4B9T0_9GAMM|nr:hypothetical protein MED297_20877 [Reinekea sp. MED297] [Reinekea blandensis MED297]